ncbi:TetR/AcrR family transcriptional regulator [Streptomyces xinghaiensis]|uniref:TetR/AcrR family transcriptional regulator n=1 Tax=Streptomyces xinghaiensis TaxID=1038928 RepID=UPI00307B8624
MPPRRHLTSDAYKTFACALLAHYRAGKSIRTLAGETGRAFASVHKALQDARSFAPTGQEEAVTAVRERLMDTAIAALSERPWTQIRLTGIAAEAGVSRQALYNEFGSKDGLARALAWREIDRYLAGVERALTRPPQVPPADRLAALADWTWRTTRTPLARAVLTNCWDVRLPRPSRAAALEPPGPFAPEKSRAGKPLPSPAELMDQVRDMAVAALAPDQSSDDRQRTVAVCELAVRVALSFVIAPAGELDAAQLIWRALHPLISDGPTAERLPARAGFSAGKETL